MTSGIDSIGNTETGEDGMSSSPIISPLVELGSDMNRVNFSSKASSRTLSRLQRNVNVHKDDFSQDDTFIGDSPSF